MESATLTATTTLLKAVQLDTIERYNTVLSLYQESLRILTDLIKETKSQKKRKEFKAKADKYRNRAASIKILIQTKKVGGKCREQTKIEDGSIGFGYSTVFGRFLDSSVTHIHIEDPYIRAFHQCQNLVRFCELAVQKCRLLSKITLVTTHADLVDRKDQTIRLHELRISLNARQVTFVFSFSSTLHDRQVRLNNGWVIKIGRGLDYFQNSPGKFTIGNFDLELRPCLETTVDIFYAYTDQFANEISRDV